MAVWLLRLARPRLAVILVETQKNLRHQNHHILMRQPLILNGSNSRTGDKKCPATSRMIPIGSPSLKPLSAVSWSLIKDTSTDSGNTSGQSSYSLGGSKKLAGPYNASCVNLVSVGQSGMLRWVLNLVFSYKSYAIFIQNDCNVSKFGEFCYLYRKLWQKQAPPSGRKFCWDKWTRRYSASVHYSPSWHQWHSSFDSVDFCSHCKGSFPNTVRFFNELF